MPIKRHRRGSGITQKDAVTITGPFGDEERAEARRMLNLSLELRMLRPIEAQLRAILRNAGITSDHEKFPNGSEAYGWRGVARLHGVKEDDPEDFAAQLLEQLGLLRALITPENQDAVRFGIEFGLMLKEAETKLRWEADAVPTKNSV